MKEHLKIVSEKKIVYADPATGQVFDEETQTTKVVVGDSGEFIMLFVAIEAKLNDLSLSEERVFRHCCLQCNKKNEITFTRPTIERFSKESGLAEQTIRNCVSNLTKKKMLLTLHKGGGVYIVNPRYLCKQKLSEHKKLMRYVLDIVCPDC